MADIHVRENGATVKVSPADRIVVHLPENATTGYRWSLSPLPGGIEMESDDVLLAERPAAGAGALRVMVFRGRRPGRAKIVLLLARPWERQSPVDRFFVNVSIR
jgi:inhibitor of cysteine peptidase